MNDDTHSELFEYALNHIDGITYTDGKRIMKSLSPSERILFRKRISEKYHNSTLTYQDLQMQSQFIDAHQDINNLDDIIMLHSHNFCEMIYINSGELEYILGSARYMVRSKDAILPWMLPRKRQLLTEKFAQAISQSDKRIGAAAPIRRLNDAHRRIIQSLYRPADPTDRSSPAIKKMSIMTGL